MGDTEIYIYNNCHLRNITVIVNITILSNCYDIILNHENLIKTFNDVGSSSVF